MKPRVCLFTDSYEPSGMGEHMLLIAEELRYSHTLFLACLPGTALQARAQALGLQTLAIDNRDDGNQISRLAEQFRSPRFDIFHGHAGIGWEGHNGVYAARAAGIPIVLRTEHLPFLITEEWQRAQHRRMLASVDKIICVSEEACGSFVREGIPYERLEAVLNGIKPRKPGMKREQARRLMGFDSHQTLALTVGRMTEQKGHTYLLDAARCLLDGGDEAHFLIAGEGPLRGDLLTQVRQLGLEENVTFIGHHANVPLLLSAVDLFVLPSLFEGLPLVVLEAMFAGLPVVGTRVCGTSEAIADGVTGRLVEPKDPRALANAIVEVLHSRDKGALWGEAGRQRAERLFTASRMAKETAAIYHKLMGEKTLAKITAATVPMMREQRTLVD
ncbi:MAG: glycosyltransferase family 4 protein [Chloroflexota bacterium]|nr:glycosyltransferase family 4 protein [Chloroflexota bacterium]